MRYLPLSSPPPNILAPNDEGDCSRADQEHDSRENHANNQEPPLLNPHQDLETHSKCQSTLCGNENSNQLWCVTVITVDHVRDEDGKSNEVGALENTISCKKPEPVEFEVRGTGEHSHTDGR